MLNNRLSQIATILQVMRPIHQKDLNGTINSDDKILFVSSQQELKTIYELQPPLVLFPDEDEEIRFYINYTIVSI